MSIWKKLYIVFILLASIAFWYLGMRALATHRAWREAALQLQQQIEQTKQQRERLVHGDGTNPGIRQLELEIHKWQTKRGRVWYGARPAQLQQQRGPNGAPVVQVRVAIDTLGPAAAPEEQPIPVDSVVFVFDERDIRQGGRYLGEFRVRQVVEAQGDQPKQLVLEATTVLSARQMQYLQQSVNLAGQGQTTWTICDILPFDNHEAFAGMDPEVLREILPASSVEEYIRDGQPIDPNQPESERYERQLCDYTILFRVHQLEEVELLDRIASMKRNIDWLNACLDDAKREEGVRQQEIAQLTADLEQANRELAATQAHLKAVESTLECVTQARDDLIRQNMATAAAIADAQTKAAELIEARVRAMAAAQESATP
ncbi:MAG: hypothetical protein D6741_08605, partial [Planctomycetota bacterium]